MMITGQRKTKNFWQRKTASGLTVGQTTGLTIVIMFGIIAWAFIESL